MKVNDLRIRKAGPAKPICEQCGSETREIGRCGMGRLYACPKCEPDLFAELERMGLLQ